ncbi:MAG: RNA polymerase sigma factor [Calditrichaeota bacterium]|nr:RNA polymerase sigma factor [Calditrichota bacterium]
MNAYKKTIYFYVLRIVKNHDLADDVSQLVFIKVYKNLKQFKGNSSFKTWVLRIATNTSLTELSKNKRHQHDDLQETTLHLIDGFQDNVVETNFKNAVDKTLDYLSPVQRMVFTLRHIHGKSTKETSHIMDCSEGHIKKQLFLAIQKIRVHLNKLYPDHQWS